MFDSPIAFDDLYQELDSTIRLEEASGFFGAVLVQHLGRIVLNKGYGPLRGVQMTPNSRCWIASTGKQFTSAAILKCQDDGMLLLDDPKGRFIPNVPADKKEITIRQLLSHTSGLAQGFESESVDDRETATELILDKSRVDRPGNNFLYSNDNYQLAAAIVEIVSGARYEYFVSKNLFTPLNLRETGQAVAGKDPMVAPTISDLPPHVLGRRWGQQSYYSTTHDLFTWYQALKNWEILSKERVEQLFQPVAPIKEGYSALGWFIRKINRAILCIFTRGNEDFGANSLLYAYPDTKTVIVVLAHSGDKDHDISYSRWIHTMIEETLFPFPAT
jgi:CubicO group peptidase (beta-lactamase class C family)